MKSKNCWTIEEGESGHLPGQPISEPYVGLLPGERMDQIGFGGLFLIQKPSSFCYGIDAVLLADFTARYAKASDRICDLGTGTGILPLILSHKTQASHLVGVEIQLDSARRAARNAAGNQLSHRIEILWEDVGRIGLKGENENPSKRALKPSSFDLVVSNPPYMRRGAGLLNGADAKTVARHETTAELSDFIGAAAFLLKERGSLCIIHRPNRLVDLFVLCRENGLEPKELQMICPRMDSCPNLALVRCSKGGNSDLRVLESLWVYDSQGNRSKRVNEMYAPGEFSL